MDIVLPFGLYERAKLREAALAIGYSDAQFEKFYLLFHLADYDVYETTGDARIEELVVGWHLINEQLGQPATAEVKVLPSSVEFMMKVLMHHTLNLWFSNEFNMCAASHKATIFQYFFFCCKYFDRVAAAASIDWRYLELFEMSPWRVAFIQHLLFRTLQDDQTDIECEVPMCNLNDAQYLCLESFPIIILRLVVLCNTSMWGTVKELAMRVLMAWNCSSNALNESTENKELIYVICHIYLMAVYAGDEKGGFYIDNTMHNVRFYLDNYAEAKQRRVFTSYTPARLIADTCKKLKLTKHTFFEKFAFNGYDECTTTIFGIITTAYTSYLLGNILMELMTRNEDDFEKQLQLFKDTLERYIEVRERSERFIASELKKMAAKQISHAKPNTLSQDVQLHTLICKGNNASNVCGYGSDMHYPTKTDDNLATTIDGGEVLPRPHGIDPVFQNLPNNEHVLTFVYTALSRRKYIGWDFAKVVVLLKIISHKTQMIETWRYHPGLTTDFMLNLERNLAGCYADLAIIFSEHQFMEQEFWLTAFYLNPCSAYFKEIKRCGLRVQRQRQNLEEDVVGGENGELDLDLSALKFELLSSTIDVDALVNLVAQASSATDYEVLAEALRKLQLPEYVVKDLITVIYQPRNKSLAWALDWKELRMRSKNLIAKETLKRHLVEQNMAEANDRLKYLEINYEEYKDRPQLDYGTIEEGYENFNPYNSLLHRDTDSEDDDDEEFEISPRRAMAQAKAKALQYSESEESDDDESYEEYQSVSRLRSRATAASTTIANSNLIVPKEQEVEAQIVLTPSVVEPQENLVKRDFGKVLQERDAYGNQTPGFRNFVNIWDFNKQELLAIECKTSTLLQSGFLLEKHTALQKAKIGHANNNNVSMQDTDDTDCTDVSTTAVHDYENDDVNISQVQWTSISPGVGVEVSVKDEAISIGQYVVVDVNEVFKRETAKEADTMPLTTIGAKIKKRRLTGRSRSGNVCFNESKLHEISDDSNSSDHCDQTPKLPQTQALNVTVSCNNENGFAENTKTSSKNGDSTSDATEAQIVNSTLPAANSNATSINTLSVQRKQKKKVRNTFGTSDLLLLAKRKLGGTQFPSAPAANVTKPAPPNDVPMPEPLLEVWKTEFKLEASIQTELETNIKQMSTDEILPPSSKIRPKKEAEATVWDKDAKLISTGEIIVSNTGEVHTPASIGETADTSFELIDGMDFETLIPATTTPVFGLKSALKKPGSRSQQQPLAKQRNVTFAVDTIFEREPKDEHKQQRDKDDEHRPLLRSNDKEGLDNFRVEIADSSDCDEVAAMKPMVLAKKQPVVRLRKISSEQIAVLCSRKLRVMVKRIKMPEHALKMSNGHKSVKCESEQFSKRDNNKTNGRNTPQSRKWVAKTTCVRMKARRVVQESDSNSNSEDDQPLIQLEKKPVTAETYSDDEDEQPLNMLKRARRKDYAGELLPSDVENEQPKRKMRKLAPSQDEAQSDSDSEYSYPLMSRKIQQRRQSINAGRPPAYAPSSQTPTPQRIGLRTVRGNASTWRSLVQDKLNAFATTTSTTTTTISPKDPKTRGSLSLRESASVILKPIKEAPVDPLS